MTHRRDVQLGCWYCTFSDRAGFSIVGLSWLNFLHIIRWLNTSVTDWYTVSQNNKCLYNKMYTNIINIKFFYSWCVHTLFWLTLSYGGCVLTWAMWSKTIYWLHLPFFFNPAFSHLLQFTLKMQTVCKLRHYLDIGHLKIILNDKLWWQHKLHFVRHKAQAPHWTFLISICRRIRRRSSGR